jgi:hypothetical protein
MVVRLCKPAGRVEVSPGKGAKGLFKPAGMSKGAAGKG